MRQLIWLDTTVSVCFWKVVLADKLSFMERNRRLIQNVGQTGVAELERKAVEHAA